MPFHKSNDYKLTAVQYYSFMRPFEKPFVENLFINIIKGKYWGMFSTFNYQLFLYETFWKSFIENLFINIIKGKYVYRWDVLNI
jgi:hypothetical protein